MSIDTRFTPAIRNALLEQMQDVAGRYSPDGSNRRVEEGHSGPVAGADSISLSAEALQIHAAVSNTAGQDVFDFERVTDIRHALVSGMYQVDPERLADKFYRFTINL